MAFGGKLKRDRPFQYWIRIFIVSYWIVNLSMVGLVGADAPENGVTANELTHGYDEVNLNPYSTGAGGRQSNGTLWEFHTVAITYTSDHEFIANYSTDNGTTWDGFVLMDNTFLGFELNGLPWQILDCAMLSNNSIIVAVVLKNFDTGSQYELWLFAHWNNSDLSQWELIDIYSHASYSVDKDATIAVNNTDIVMITYEVDLANRVYYDFLNCDTRFIDQNEKVTIEPSHGPYALCNSTGVFFVGVVIQADADLDVYTTDGSWTLVFTQSFWSSYYLSDIVVTGDDTFVFITGLTSGGYLKLYYWNTTDSGVREIVDGGTGDLTVEWPKLMLQNDTDTHIRICGYSNQDDGFKFASADYFRDDEYWQLTWGVVAWSETDDSQKTYNRWMPHDLFPHTIDPVTGVKNRTNLPNTGALCYINDYTVLGDTEDIWEFHLNTTTWPGCPYYDYDPFYEPPEEPDTPGNETETQSAMWWDADFCVTAIIILIFVFFAVMVLIRVSDL